ncbi:MAG: hypothetical protein ACRD1U_07570 [Vicinamibacterales bacterium]
MAAQVAAMVGASVACSAALFLTLPGEEGRGAVLLGMAGPLAVAGSTWMLVVRLHQRAPDQVSALMIKLFAAKVVLFGAYVAVAVMRLSPENVVPFVVSFTCHYILLHLMEAFYLRRLFAGDQHALGR